MDADPNTVVVRFLTRAEALAHAHATVPSPCAVGREVRTRMAAELGAHASTPVEQLHGLMRTRARALAREWRAHFTTCPACYDVFAHEAADKGAKILSPPRPEVAS